MRKRRTGTSPIVPSPAATKGKDAFDRARPATAFVSVSRLRAAGRQEGKKPIREGEARDGFRQRVSTPRSRDRHLRPLVGHRAELQIGFWPDRLGGGLHVFEDGLRFPG